MKDLNLFIRFLLELMALYAYGYAGFSYGKGFFMKMLLSIGMPMIVALIWGIFISPKAVLPIRGLGQICLEVLIFGTAVVFLFGLGQHRISLLLGGLYIVNRLFMIWWKQ